MSKEMVYRFKRCGYAAILIAATVVQYAGAESGALLDGDVSVLGKADSLKKTETQTGNVEGKPGAAQTAPAASGFAICGILGGNLPKIIPACDKPYLVTADAYVAPGKTVRIEQGAVLLFKNFTGIHVEGKLVVEGTAAHPIIFSSEFDHAFNPQAALHANPFDWNGIFIHESGLGSSMANCTVRYSVYGVNSLTKYIMLDKASFQDNGRADCAIESRRLAGKDGPITYALTLDDAKKDGVPVKILMDPQARKRSVLKFGGLSLFTGGCFMAIFSAIQLRGDQTRLNGLSDKKITDERSNVFVNSGADWRKAQIDRNRDLALTVVGICGAVAGGVGFGISFTF